MPHLSVKLAVGRSEQQKTRLVEALVQEVMRVLDCREEVVSVGLEEIEPRDWPERVYKPDIAGKWETLYKKPGYTV